MITALGMLAVCAVVGTGIFWRDFQLQSEVRAIRADSERLYTLARDVGDALKNQTWLRRLFASDEVATIYFEQLLTDLEIHLAPQGSEPPSGARKIAPRSNRLAWALVLIEKTPSRPNGERKVRLFIQFDGPDASDRPLRASGPVTKRAEELLSLLRFMPCTPVTINRVHPYVVMEVVQTSQLRGKRAIELGSLDEYMEVALRIRDERLEPQ